jgi:CotH kinase protein
MQSTSLLKLFSAVVLMVGSTLASAQSPPSPGCTPPEYANLPVVNTGLPVVQIWTANLEPVDDRENYIDACMRITDGSKVHYGQGIYHGTLQIRGRGNTTWNMPKKGYRLKLTAANAVFDMPAHRDWVLLANYADKTLLRTNVAFELSRRFKMPWTPRMRYAEFYLNNEFLGNYQIGDRIEVGPQRVNITKMSTTDVTPPAVDGGYLLQAEYTDRLEVGDTYFTTAPVGTNFLMESPSGSAVQPQQLATISSYVQGLEDAILAGNFSSQTGVPSRMNVDSLVAYYLVQELLKNKDSPMGSSVYLYKDRTGPLFMGPLWDFDISAGNIDFYPPAMKPDGWYLRNQSAWFESLMQTPEFKSLVKDRWKQMRPSSDELKKFIDSQASMLDASQKANFQRWPILNTYVWPNQVVTGSYKNEVSWLKDWLKKRIEWMDKHISE